MNLTTFYIKYYIRSVAWEVTVMTIDIFSAFVELAFSSGK